MKNNKKSDNPNVYTDFKSFRLGGKYSVTESYKNRKDMTEFKYIETVDGYDTYESPTPGYVYVLSVDFFGLASLIELD